MRYRVRFAVKQAGRALAYREVGDNDAEFVCCFGGIPAIKKALAAAGLPSQIAREGDNTAVYEVSENQLRRLGFAIGQPVAESAGNRVFFPRKLH